jgi:hypothetical protein
MSEIYMIFIWMIDNRYRKVLVKERVAQMLWFLELTPYVLKEKNPKNRTFSLNFIR